MAQSYAAGAKTGNTIKKGVEKQSFDESDFILMLMTLLYLSRNASISPRLKMKVLELLDMLDEERWSNNAEMYWRVMLARGVATAYMREGAKTLTAIEHRLCENTDLEEYHKEFFEAYRNGTGHAVDGMVLPNELSDEDVHYVDSYVSTRLRYAFLYSAAPQLRTVADKIQSEDVGEISGFNEETMLYLESVVQKGRRAQAATGFEAQDFVIGDSSFGEALRSTHRKRTAPQSNIRTGLRMLNDCLGGGWQGSRTYVIFGRSGDWKSGFLLNAAMWCCDPRYNPEFVLKDPRRKPCVLYITQENDRDESIERIISHSVGSHVELKDYTEDQIVQMLEDALASESCHFCFKFRPDRSISTADIDTMIQDLYMEGYEVVMVVQDYIKRIRAVENFRDMRHLELGAIVNEMSTLAKKYGIPFLTGMQLKREAYEKFDNAIKSGKSEAVKAFGAQDVGESINVFENADAVFFNARIAPESLEGQQFLQMRRAKMRGKRTGGLDTFSYSFDTDANGDVNEMRLVQDAHLPKNQCKGIKELGNGIAAAYDPNNAGADQKSGVGLSHARISGGQGRRPAAPARRAAPAEEAPASDAPPRSRRVTAAGTQDPALDGL